MNNKNYQIKEEFQTPLLLTPIKFQTINKEGEVIVIDLDRKYISIFNYGRPFDWEEK